MEERIQVHHNYISTISNQEHKKDLINKLKRSDPHNIPAYEAEMTHHMVMHDDVLGRILTILKQDDYYRTLEELPVIDGLTTYNDIQLFPELYDTTTIIERVIGEADLIEKQLRQPGMYPLPKTPLPSTSGFVPRPTSTFQPIVPDTSPEPVNTHHTNNPQNAETSPESSLPCGQWTPMGSTSANSTPSQHTPPQSAVPPQPATQQSHNLNNTAPHTQLQRHHNHLLLHNLNSSLLLGQILIRPPSLPFQLQKHTDLCPAHHCSTFLSLQMVKECRTVSQRLDPVHPMDDSVSTANNQDTSRKTAQSNHTAPSGGQEDMYRQGALLNSNATGQIRKDVKFGRTARAMKLTKKSGKGHRTNHSFCTRITDVYTVPAITNPVTAPQDNNTRLTPLAVLPVAQVFIKTPANF